MSNYQEARRVPLKGHAIYNERWLQDRIVQNPSLLGLGDLEVKDYERRQPSGGRLDLLLYEPESLTRYEVELQLGATDETHIIRTIEYWDIERRRFPQYEHIAVLVAEDITSRFLNVVSLFNGFIPLVAIQVQGLEVGGAFTLSMTKVMDVMKLGLDDEEEGTPVDRSYWENTASNLSLKIVDEVAELVREIDPTLHLKYNRYSIGFAGANGGRNQVRFRPRKQHVIAEFPIDPDDTFRETLAESGVDLIPLSAHNDSCRLRLGPADVERHRSTILDLIQRADQQLRG